MSSHVLGSRRTFSGTVVRVFLVKSIHPLLACFEAFEKRIAAKSRTSSEVMPGRIYLKSASLYATIKSWQKAMQQVCVSYQVLRVIKLIQNFPKNQRPQVNCRKFYTHPLVIWDYFLHPMYMASGPITGVTRTELPLFWHRSILYYPVVSQYQAYQYKRPLNQ